MFSADGWWNIPLLRGRCRGICDHLSEDWSTYAAGDVPAAPYSVENGGGTTKIYADALAGVASPDLLVAKSEGSLSVYLTDLKGKSGAFTLTFKSNKVLSVFAPEFASG